MKAEADRRSGVMQTRGTSGGTANSSFGCSVCRLKIRNRVSFSPVVGVWRLGVQGVTKLAYIAYPEISVCRSCNVNAHEVSGSINST